MRQGLIAGWGKLISTNAASGILQLAGFAVAARALDVGALGAIVLIQSYVRVVDGLFNFQSVNVLTRYLAAAEHTDDSNQFRGLVKAGLLVDALTAFLATAVAILALPTVGPIVGISGEWIGPAMLYCLVIATRVLGVSEAVLRCFDRFWSIGLRGTVNGILLVLASFGAWWLGADARVFLYVWLGAEAAANVGFIAWALFVARAEGITGICRADAGQAIRSVPRFWAMLWQTNATFAVRMLSQDADVLVAGGVLGPGAAGLLRAAKNLSAVVTQFGRPLQQVASAPISRLAAAGKYDELLSYVRRICLAAGAASLLLVLGAAIVGGQVLGLLYGVEFASAKWPLVALLFTAALFMFGVALLPLAIALDRAEIAFNATVWGTLTYFALMALLIRPMGILGVAIAHVGFNAVWLASSVIMTGRAHSAAKETQRGQEPSGA